MYLLQYIVLSVRAMRHARTFLGLSVHFFLLIFIYFIVKWKFEAIVVSAALSSTTQYAMNTIHVNYLSYLYNLYVTL